MQVGSFKHHCTDNYLKQGQAACEKTRLLKQQYLRSFPAYCSSGCKKHDSGFLYSEYSTKMFLPSYCLPQHFSASSDKLTSSWSGCYFWGGKTNITLSVQLPKCQQIFGLSHHRSNNETLKQRTAHILRFTSPLVQFISFSSVFGKGTLHIISTLTWQGAVTVFEVLCSSLSMKRTEGHRITIAHH